METRISRVLLLLAIIVALIYASPVQSCCTGPKEMRGNLFCEGDCCLGLDEKASEVPYLGVLVSCVAPPRERVLSLQPQSSKTMSRAPALDFIFGRPSRRQRKLSWN